MARIRVDLPDEIMGKLKRLKHRIKISQVCREALDRRLATIGEKGEGLDIENLIPRLREERVLVEGKWEELGRRNATIWLDGASYLELKAVTTDESPSDMDRYKLPPSAFRLMRLETKEAQGSCRGHHAVAYKSAWLHYVREIWQQVVAELDQVEKPGPKGKPKPMEAAEATA